ncbi:type III-B CRISPR module RAMP protein Cmr1 [Propionivibrio sp.]|uniref:type III-B CRISPR module RAMP protein Cmr1 n=1 Tax=Propionivibrio sp. TaxID=2212460 RepID=UPI003BF01646
MALRKPPVGLEPASIHPAGDPGIRWQSYSCELVTPLYGGGVTAGVVDEAMPIRASSIRGQLRFWWRLLAKHKYGFKGDDLRNREFELWGGLGDEVHASKVWLKVTAVSKPSIEAWAEYTGKRIPDPKDWANAAYALFPGQGKKPGLPDSSDPASLVKPGLKWTLCLGWNSDLAQSEQMMVLETLRWWASFGGLGARNRRGLGAVFVTNLAPVSAPEVTLAACRLVFSGSASANPLKAWQDAVAKLKAFRQDENIGRNPQGAGSSRPGRSRWPEAASIRVAAGQHRVKQDGTSFAPPAGTPALYPRAAFGLPIVFHFQGERGDQRGDPVDVILEPGECNGKRSERMASPLILHPYLLENGKWQAAALLLPSCLTEHQPLALRRGVSLLASGHLMPKDATEQLFMPANSPMKGRGEGALNAFLHFFEGSAPIRGGEK